MKRRFATALCVLAVGIYGTLAGNVHAAGSLAQLALQPSDVPPGFGAIHTKSYTKFVRKMTVTTTKKGSGKGKSSCDVPKYYKTEGWTAGLISAADGPSILSALNLCASSFPTSKQAHAAFLKDEAGVRAQVAKNTGIKVVSTAPLGDESITAGGATGAFADAIIQFRVRTTIVTLFYLGSSSYSFKSVFATAQAAASRAP